EAEIAKKMNHDFTSFLENWYKAPLFSLDDATIAKLQNSTSKSPELYTQALQCYGLSKQPRLWDTLNSANPIVLVGSKDQKFCTLHPRALAIPNCGHKASHEAPKLVYSMVMDEIARRNWHH